MTGRTLPLAGLTGCILFAAALGAMAQERKLSHAQLPAAVAAALDRETQGATIKGYASEREAGKRVYEAGTIVNGHTRDVQVAEDGTLNEIEEEVSFASLDPAVQSALTAKAEGARIVKVESLTKHATLVAYEAATIRNGTKGEVQVGPGGKTLSHPE